MKPSSIYVSVMAGQAGVPFSKMEKVIELLRAIPAPAGGSYYHGKFDGAVLTLEALGVQRETIINWIDSLREA